MPANRPVDVPQFNLAEWSLITPEDPGSNPKGKMGQKYAMLFLKTKPYFFHFSSVPKLFTQEFIYDNCGQSYKLQL